MKPIYIKNQIVSILNLPILITRVAMCLVSFFIILCVITWVAMCLVIL
jgi:hypothetical protein